MFSIFKIPYEDIVAKLKEKKGLSQEEIDAKIKQKLDQLSGLISKEGAAHIIANELGVKLFEEFSGKLEIKNVLAGMRNVETVGKVTQVFELREFVTENRQGKVASFIAADKTGSIRVVLWGSQADNIKQIKEGTIIKLIGGYVRDNQGRLEVHMNDRSNLVLNPPGEKIDEVTITQQTQTAERKKIDELKENDRAEILGTIVQAFDPRFFEVCSNCGKRAKMQEGSFVCAEHGKVNPDYSYVMNLFLDDGKGNIRAIFFRDQMLKLLNMNKDQAIQFKDTPEAFEEIKNNLLGNIIKVKGRVKKNAMFDRLEFMTDEVDIDPDPKEEIKKLEAEKVDS